MGGRGRVVGREGRGREGGGRGGGGGREGGGRIVQAIAREKEMKEWWRDE